MAVAPEDDRLPPQRRFEIFEGMGRTVVNREVASLLPPGTGLYEQLDALEDHLLASFDSSWNDAIRGKLFEGYLPLDDRRILTARSVPLIGYYGKALVAQEPSRRRMIPDGAIAVASSAYYKAAQVGTTLEQDKRRKYLPVAYEYADRFPEIHLADRLRRRIEQRQEFSFQLQAASLRDLVIIYGMSLSALHRQLQQRAGQNRTPQAES